MKTLNDLKQELTDSANEFTIENIGGEDFIIQLHYKGDFSLKHCYNIRSFSIVKLSDNNLISFSVKF